MLETPRETRLAEPFEDKQLFEMCLTQEVRSSQNVKFSWPHLSPGSSAAAAQLSPPLSPQRLPDVFETIIANVH